MGESVSCVTAHPRLDLVLLGTSSGKVLVFDPTCAAITQTVQAHDLDLTRIVFINDDSELLTSSLDGLVHRWDSQLSRKSTYSVGTPVYATTLSPSGRELALGGDDRQVYIVDGETGKRLAVLSGHPDAVTACLWHRNGHLVTGGAEGNLRVWEVEARRCIRQSRPHQQQISQLLASRQGQWYLSASWDRTIKAWNLQHRERFAYSAGPHSVMSIALSEDEQLMAAGYWDGAILVWDLRTGAVFDQFQAHDEGLVGCAWLPGTQQVLSVDQQGRVRSWSRAEMGVKRFVNRHASEIYSVHYTPDNVHVVTASHDGQLKLWDRSDHGELGYIDAQAGPLLSSAIALDNDLWAVGTADGTVKIWDVQRQCFDILIPAHKESVTALAFHPLGRRLISGSWDMKLKLWSLGTQSLQCVFDGHSKEISACDVSPDGQKLVSASWDCTVRIWDLVDTSRGMQRERFVLEGHSERVLDCAFSPDGLRVLSASADRTARIWSADRIEEPKILLGHTSPITCCRFSPDGRLIATADLDGVVMVWDAQLGTNLSGVRHDGAILALGIAPDATQAAVGDREGAIRFFELGYRPGPSWTAATTTLRAASLWMRGAPPAELHEVTCIYCGATEPVKPKDLGSPWSCPRCQSLLHLCPRAIPPASD